MKICDSCKCDIHDFYYFEILKQNRDNYGNIVTYSDYKYKRELCFVCAEQISHILKIEVKVI